MEVGQVARTGLQWGSQSRKQRATCRCGRRRLGRGSGIRAHANIIYDMFAVPSLKSCLPSTGKELTESRTQNIGRTANSGRLRGESTTVANAKSL